MAKYYAYENEWLGWGVAHLVDIVELENDNEWGSYAINLTTIRGHPMGVYRFIRPEQLHNWRFI